jgi:GNAT superfamily N-acetyltransferase
MIEIRKATVQDLQTLTSFQQSLAFESEGITLNEESLTAGMLALLTDPNKGVYYVALDEQRIVGCHLITYEWSEWRNGMVWWLQSVYVAQSHRNKGVFRAMFKNIIRMIQDDPSLIGLRLYVDKTNAKAMQVYDAMGMNGEHYTVYEWMKS